MTKRFVFIVPPGDRARETSAFVLAKKLTEDGKHPLTYVGTMVGQFGEFRDILGEKHTKKVIDRKLVDLPINAEKVINPQDIKPYQEKGVILGIRCSADTLEKIDQCDQAKAVVLLAFNEKEGQAWAKKHRAKIVSAPTDAEE